MIEFPFKHTLLTLSNQTTQNSLQTSVLGCSSWFLMLIFFSDIEYYFVSINDLVPIEEIQL